MTTPGLHDGLREVRRHKPELGQRHEPAKGGASRSGLPRWIGRMIALAGRRRDTPPPTGTETRLHD
jgi:hypothetical protein